VRIRIPSILGGLSGKGRKQATHISANTRKTPQGKLNFLIQEEGGAKVFKKALMGGSVENVNVNISILKRKKAGEQRNFGGGGGGGGGGGVGGGGGGGFLGGWGGLWWVFLGGGWENWFCVCGGRYWRSGVGGLEAMFILGFCHDIRVSLNLFLSGKSLTSNSVLATLSYLVGEKQARAAGGRMFFFTPLIKGSRIGEGAGKSKSEGSGVDHGRGRYLIHTE